MKESEKLFNKNYDSIADTWVETKESYKEDMISFAEAYLKSKVEAITYEETSNHIERYIKDHGYQLHPLASNEALAQNGVENIIDWFKEKLLKK